PVQTGSRPRSDRVTRVRPRPVQAGHGALPRDAGGTRGAASQPRECVRLGWSLSEEGRAPVSVGQPLSLQKPGGPREYDLWSYGAGNAPGGQGEAATVSSWGRETP